MKEIFEKFLDKEITIKFSNMHEFKFKVFIVSDNYFGLKLRDRDGYFPYNSVSAIYIKGEDVLVELKRFE